MAEGLFKHLLKAENICDKYSVRSAGTSAYLRLPASGNAIKALHELNIDLGNHKSTAITKEMIQEADLILTMTRSHKAYVIEAVSEAASKVCTLKEYAGEDVSAAGAVDVADPYGGDIEIYRMCRDEILAYLKKVLNKLEREE